MEPATLIDLYCQAWSEPTPGHRAELLRGVWAANASYTDPTVHAQGAVELLAHITKVQAIRPGARVIRTSEVDHHHAVARFAWCAMDANGHELRDGIDITFISADGLKIESIIGFFGPIKRGGV